MPTVISRLRNSLFSKVLWGLMSLYLFNISADATDPYPQHISEDLSINDQESFIEIIVEKILGYENAIREYDDNDNRDQEIKTNLKIDLFNQSPVGNLTQRLVALKPLNNFSEYRTDLSRGFQTRYTPPPKF
jgi:hypothetical protein